MFSEKTTLTAFPLADSEGAPEAQMAEFMNIDKMAFLFWKCFLFAGLFRQT
ncbi:MAG: hypothetical protein IKD83_01115 [Firmicutes bacterium]|nr:hypothetical protein [Bacillota bacterium]MBR2593207.1 hypothetical protein [Bacillota bacterium]